MDRLSRRTGPAFLRCAIVVICLGTSLAQAETASIEEAMPAPIVEIAPPPPRVGVAWVPGHWVWRGAEWFWVKGHYVEGIVPAMPAAIVEAVPPAPSPTHVWVRGHWGWDEGRWNWHRGVWFRP